MEAQTGTVALRLGLYPDQQAADVGGVINMKRLALALFNDILEPGLGQMFLSDPWLDGGASP